MDVHIFLSCKVFQELRETFLRGPQTLIVGIAHVKCENGLGRNNVDSVGLKLNGAHCGDGWRRGCNLIAQESNHSRRSNTSIVTHRDRSSARMVSDAIDCHSMPGNALQVLNHANGAAFDFENRPLFDMELEIHCWTPAARSRRSRISATLEFLAQNAAISADS